MTNPLLCLDVKQRGENAVIPAPPVCLLLFTYRRTELAVRTVQGIADHLDYPKELLSFYVADDGSEPQHVTAILETIRNGGVRIAGSHNHKFQPGTTFCGEGWNLGLQKAHGESDFVLVLEDDWVLKSPLDIRPYLQLLIEREDVGMIRLGTLAVGNTVKIVGHGGIHYLEYTRNEPYAYSGNPHIRHSRFTNYYGLFAVDRNPGDVEVNYDWKFRDMKAGPNIWRPAAIDPWGAFAHVGTERTFS